MNNEEIQTLVSEGVSLHLEGNYKEAEKKYRKVLKSHKDNEITHNNLGLLLSQLGDLDAAADEFKKAVKINPDFGTAYSNLGQTFIAMKKWKLAEENLRKAVALDQTDYIAVESCARLYMLNGNSDLAEHFWKQAYSIRPSAEILFNLAHCLVGQQKMDEAENALIACKPFSGENSIYYNLMGIIDFSKNNFGQAIYSFRQVLGLEPENIDARQSLAICLVKTGNTIEAIKEFQRILSMDASHTEALNNLGVILFSAGDIKAALRHFERTIALESLNGKALYYKGIILIREGKKNKGEGLLKKLANTGNGEYKIKAEEALKFLEKNSANKN